MDAETISSRVNLLADAFAVLLHKCHGARDERALYSYIP